MFGGGGVVLGFGVVYQAIVINVINNVITIVVSSIRLSFGVIVFFMDMGDPQVFGLGMRVSFDCCGCCV